MSAHRPNICRYNLSQAIQALLGEFLLVCAVLILLIQSFAAQAAPTFDVICGEQGAVVIAVDVSNEHGQCPDCTSCDECLATSEPPAVLHPNNNLRVEVLVAQNSIQILDLGVITLALTHAQMLRGPPARKSDNYMHFNATTNTRRMGVLS
ncbi:hypothetical protein [Maritalea sp.]|uniref:hypothetical protein n=1 Tax=Maritalea sp. TaxID=2003361 RepID=UPI003EF11710